MASEEKPSVLIIGGLGFLGRNLAKWIHDQQLAKEIRLVDKKLPELAFLAPEFQDVCTPDRFLQADASRAEFFPKIFARPEGEAPFTYVFNCGGESRFGDDQETFKLQTYLLSTRLGREVSRRRIHAYVECSTGLVYEAASTPRKENDKLRSFADNSKEGPGKWRQQAAQDLKNFVDGQLNMVVLRLPNVYGDYCVGMLGTALCMARCFQETGGEMKWLWEESLRCHTIHVSDAVRALWTAAVWRGNTPWAATPVLAATPRDPSLPRPFYPVFNLVDHSDTTQKRLADLIATVFGIPTGFHSKLVSAFARRNLDSLLDDMNEETLDTWGELAEKSGVAKGPIGPYAEVGLLREQHLNLDGGEFERTTGFRYERVLDERAVRGVIDSYRRMGWWP